MAFSPSGNMLALSAGPEIHIVDLDPLSSSFKKDICTLGQTVSCKEMLISGAKGLEARAPSGMGTLRDWLDERGAIQKPKRVK
jgi:hypothetical protein